MCILCELRSEVPKFSMIFFQWGGGVFCMILCELRSEFHKSSTRSSNLVMVGWGEGYHTMCVATEIKE